MVDALTILSLLGGLVVLVVGGELLVRGAGGLALALGLSPLVVGLTVVSFATSAPELAVTLDATLAGSPELAVGNVVGSNIANVLLVLGLSALVLPLAVATGVLRQDVPVMIGFSVLALVLALDGGIGRLDGVVLVALLLAYTAWLVVASRRTERRSAGTTQAPVRRPARSARRVGVDVLLVVVGVGLLVLGARLLVGAATGIGAALGVSDLVMGLTVVAVGTSLPELATSVIAAVRGERDLAVGNVVGSNVFNLGAVLGLAAVISPGGVPVSDGALALDLPVMVVVALALLPVVFTGAAVARWEGAVFVAYYAVYVVYLVLDATGHESLPVLGGVVLSFLLPLTALTLAVLVVAEVRVLRRRRRTGRADPPPS
ncbi:calcium/sodium antiporter [Aquipuribacter nitratireducens]|uniref:Calcium/sodium antiporter n=1 Tax=Aquipuribacter nitratireducens TaxID=650104 RepID=A0ABW0GLE1_9MICO